MFTKKFLPILIILTMSLTAAWSQDGWHRKYPYKKNDSKVYTLFHTTVTEMGVATLTGVVEKDTTHSVVISAMDKKGDIKLNIAFEIDEEEAGDVTSMSRLAYSKRDKKLFAYLTTTKSNIYEITVAVESGQITHRKLNLAEETTDLDVTHNNGDIHVAATSATNQYVFNASIENGQSVIFERENTEIRIKSDSLTKRNLITAINTNQGDIMMLDSLNNLISHNAYAASEIEMNNIIGVYDTDSTAIITSSLGTQGDLIWKIDTLGEIQWSYTISNNEGDLDIKDIRSDGTGGVMIAGLMTANDLTRHFLTSISIDGDIEYTTVFQNDSTTMEDKVCLYDNHGIMGSYLIGSVLDMEEKVVTVMNLDRTGSAMCSDQIEAITLDTTTVLNRELIQASRTNTAFSYEDASSLFTLRSEEIYDVPKLSISPEKTQFCIGEEVSERLDANVPGVMKENQSYKWSTGEITDTIIATETDKKYKVDVTITEDECYILCDSVILTRYTKPQANITSQVSPDCSSAQLFVSSIEGKPGYEYAWNTGDTGTSITVTTDGNYDVTVTDQCNQSTLASLNYVIPKPIESISVDQDVNCDDEIPENSTGSIKVNIVGGQVQSQSVFDVIDSISVSNLGNVALSNYTIQVNDFCGNTFTETVNLSGLCGGCLKYPKAFFPNGMVEIEKSFGAFNLCGDGSSIEDFQLQVFNRWGQRVYETTDIDGRWNGRIGSTDAPSEVYVYIATYTTEGEKIVDKGDVTIIR